MADDITTILKMSAEPIEAEIICYFCHKPCGSISFGEGESLAKDSIHKSCCRHLKPEHLTESFLSWDDTLPLPFCKKCLFCAEKLCQMNSKLEELQRKIERFVSAFTVEFLKSRTNIYNANIMAIETPIATASDFEAVDGLANFPIKQEQVDDDPESFEHAEKMDEPEEDIYSGYESSREDAQMEAPIEMKVEEMGVAPRRGKRRRGSARNSKPVKVPKGRKRKYNKKITSKQLQVNVRRQHLDSEGNPIPERPRRKAAVKAEATFSSWADDLSGHEKKPQDFNDQDSMDNDDMSDESESSWKSLKDNKIKKVQKNRKAVRGRQLKRNSLSGERNFKCKQCDKSYKNRHHLLEHEITHDKNRRFQCKLCDASFSYVRNLRKHLIRHDKNEPLDRRKSRKPVEEKTVKKSRTRDGKPRSYICKICAKVCNTAGHLFYHSQSHKNAEGQFKCELCNKMFKNAVTFQKHGKIHTGENKFLCSVCGKEFKSRSGQKDHELLHFEDKSVRLNRKDFECQVCHKIYSSKSSLNKHSFRHNAEKQFGCQQCDKKFATKGGLQTHMIYHKGERPFLCEECGKSFFTKTKLNEHNRIHTGMLFPCEFCDKGFQTTTHLKQHYRSHNKKITDNKEQVLEPIVVDQLILNSKEEVAEPVEETQPIPQTFQCPTCELKFDNQNSLSNHSLIHSEEFSRFLMFAN